MKPTRIALFLLLGCTFHVHAEVYKCRQPDGRTEISNSPCSGGASTLKAVPDDVVPEASRRQAERDADRLENYADKLDAQRKSNEAAENKLLKEEQAAARLGPAPANIEHCLNTVDRMVLDSTRRAELEDGCRATGSMQPVYVQDPGYYGGNGYIRPSLKPRPPTPTRPVPTPHPQPVTPAKPVDLYKVPSAPRTH